MHIFCRFKSQMSIRSISGCRRPLRWYQFLVSLVLVAFFADASVLETNPLHAPSRPSRTAGYGGSGL